MCGCAVAGGIMIVALVLLLVQFYWLLPIFSYFSYFNSPYVFTSVFGVSLLSLFKYGKRQLEYLQLQSITRTKQLERSRRLERLKTDYPLTPERVQIISLSTEVLMEQLRSRSLSAADVLGAFIAKAVEATEAFNCVTEFIPNAMDVADELDVMDELKGPLHGLPVCIKDDTNVQGMDSTLGYAKNLYKPAAESAAIVKCLKDLGAIPFCKTNVPQTLVSFASDNPIFGKTLNCNNPKMAPGGSSSGTGCLVGAGGAPFGTGTDIGGSGRIPAHFNGVASIKPSSNRLSAKGVVQATPNCVGLVGVPTIFAKHPKMVAKIFQSLTEGTLQNKYDSTALPIPWNHQVFESTRKLRIGYLTSLTFFPLMGDTEETVRKAKETLESLGHKLIPFEIPNDEKIAKLMADLANADTGTHLRKALRGEKISDAARMVNQLINMPFWLRKVLSIIVKWKYLPWFRSARAVYCLLAGMDLQLTTQLWDSMGEKQTVIQSILNQMDSQNLDLILCPVFPFPAPRVDDPKDLVVAVVYCMLWNLCDFPAGVIKFGLESGKNIESFNDEGDMFLKIAKKGIRDSIGMPIGVQLVGRPYTEELVLRAMIDLDQAAKDRT